MGSKKEMTSSSMVELTQILIKFILALTAGYGLI